MCSMQSLLTREDLKDVNNSVQKPNSSTKLQYGIFFSSKPIDVVKKHIEIQYL